MEDDKKEKDFDITSYNTSELFDIFDINYFNNSHDENNTEEKIKKLKKKHREKLTTLESINDVELRSNLLSFFNDAYHKLTRILSIELVKFYENKRKNDTINAIQQYKSHPEISFDEHPRPKINEPNIQSTMPIRFPLVKINPLEKKVVKKIISIDTLFRSNYKRCASCDFTYELPTPIENVVSMKLLSAELPNSDHFFSKKNGTNYFIIKLTGGYNKSNTYVTKQELKVEIPDGTYTSANFLTSIQQILDSQRNSFSYIHVGIHSFSGKIFFRFKTLKEAISWDRSYSTTDANYSGTAPDNKKPNTPGQFKMETTLSNLEKKLKMIQYTLDLNPTHKFHSRSFAWGLGFRENTCNCLEYAHEIDPHGMAEYGPIKYDNSYNHFGTSWYGYIQSEGIYGESNNDYIFLYINDFVGNYSDGLICSLQDNHMSKCIMARIQINAGGLGVQFFEDNGSSGPIIEKQRDYFGPVKIKKLQIKLLDKFGDVLDLGDSNYSMALQFEQLYSSVRN